MPSPASSAPSARPRASDPPAASPRPPPPPYPLARAPPIRRPHPLTRLLRPIRSPARLRSGAPIPSPASSLGDFSKRASPNSWVGEDGRVWHSHDGLAPHSREPIYSPGDFSKRAPPLDSHRFADRAFTVGIGGPVGTGMTALMLALCRFLRHKYSLAADRAAYMFLLFPSTLLLLRWWIWDGCLPALAVQVYQAWLLFLYTSFALRENVLIVNGSDIRPWWIYHHYLAMLMALVSLTWEIKGQADCSSKQRGVQLFLRWAIMQGIAMHLQNRYQRQRLHTRIALGKAKRMDVVADFL